MSLNMLKGESVSCEKNENYPTIIMWKNKFIPHPLETPTNLWAYCELFASVIGSMVHSINNKTRIATQ